MHTADKPLQKSTNPVVWRALKYFNYYRVLLSGLFVVLIYADRLPRPIGSLDSEFFFATSHVYLFIALIFGYCIHKQIPRFNIQITTHVLSDIVFLSLLMYSSNGLGSGFGLLIIIAVAGGSILLEGKMAILFAAIAALFILGHELFLQFFRYFHSSNYIHAGILGATFFITAIITNLLATKIREIQALAEQQSVEINELAKLNEHIVQRMQSGIVVLDSKLNVLFMNKSSQQLLKQQEKDRHKIFHFINNYLKTHIHNWLNHKGKQNVIVKINETELQVSFIKLDLLSNYQILIFLEDIARLRQRAQQLKLASLGRLTASIAHEVRNPLGAINHASQLLQESASMSLEDKRLTEIINQHSLRINNIIENVLSVSRRAPAAVERFEILPWLQKFIAEFASRYNLSSEDIKLNSQPENIFVRIDPSQLYQVIWNLCENAMRYSKAKPMITLSCDIDKETQRPYLDVIDTGSGVAEEIKDRLFEPFTTTEAKGSGLGLYLARELCEANQANLSLHSNAKNATTFRLDFMHINKQYELI